MNVYLAHAEGVAEDAVNALLQLGVGHDLEIEAFAPAQLRDRVQPGDLVFCLDPLQLDVFADWPASCGLLMVVEEAPDASIYRKLLRLGFFDCLTTVELAQSFAQLVRDAGARFERLAADSHAPEQELRVLHDTLREEFEQDQRAAQHIQSSMLPETPQHIGQLHFTHKISASLMLSGDFVDYFALPGGYTVFYMGDVSGHGASSAFITVLLKEYSRHVRSGVYESAPDPGVLLQALNRMLLEHHLDKHVAMFLGVFDENSQTLQFCSAAHFPPAIAVIDGATMCLEQQGKPLGLFPDVPYNARALAFPVGARLVLFSDGVLELMPDTSLADKEVRLCDWVAASNNFDALWSNVKVTMRGIDDVSCLVVAHTDG